MSTRSLSSIDEAAPARTAARTPERTPERATQRTEERRLVRPSMANMTDDGRFSIDMTRVPKGYVMEFKRHSIMGATDRRNQVRIRDAHWQPVLHKQQPHILGHLCTNDDEHIVVDGLGLYMRPKYLNEDAMAEQVDNTNHVLQQQLNGMKLSSKDQVGSGNTYIKRQTVAAQPVD